MTVVLLTGLPGSGKSTLGAALASALDLPLIGKDRIKEILFASLGIGDTDWSRRVGSAAIALQYELMRIIKDVVVDSALWTDRSEPEIEALGVDVVQVYCDCPFELAYERFVERVGLGLRHPGLAEEGITGEEYERFRPLTEPLRLDAPLVRVDTSGPFDAGSVAAEVLAAVAARTLDREGGGQWQPTPTDR